MQLCFSKGAPTLLGESSLPPKLVNLPTPPYFISESLTKPPKYLDHKKGA